MNNGEAAHTITLAYVHPGFVRAEFMDSVLATLADTRYRVSLVQAGSGTNVQIARNMCFRHFLEETTDDYFMFVDSDMAWHADVPEQLIAKDVPIVSAYYLGRGHDGKGFPVGQKWATPDALGAVDTEGTAMRNVTADDLAGGGLVEVAGVGMGCCIIRREVFEALKGGSKEHPDQWPFAMGQTRLANGSYILLGEDIAMCVRAHDAGFKSYIASDIVAGHVKEFLMVPPVAGAKVADLKVTGSRMAGPGQVAAPVMAR